MHDSDGKIVDAHNNKEEHSPRNGLDLSAMGLIRRRTREMDEIRSSYQDSKGRMFNSQGKIVRPNNNHEEGGHSINGVDVTASGAMRKRALELEAIRAGNPVAANVDHNATVAPCKLNEEESSNLKTMLTTKLTITDESHEEDAAALLDYALDLIDGGDNVASVVEEVSSVCFLLILYFVALLININSWSVTFTLTFVELSFFRWRWKCSIPKMQMTLPRACRHFFLGWMITPRHVDEAWM